MAEEAHAIKSPPSKTRKRQSDVPPEIVCPTVSPPRRRRLSLWNSVRYTVVPGSGNLSPPTSPPPELQSLMRVVVCGPENAGKTSLLESFVNRKYVSKSEVDEGVATTSSSEKDWQVDYFKKDYSLESQTSDQTARLQFYDCSPPSGDDILELSQLATTLMERAHNILLAISLKDPEFQKTMSNWLEILNREKVVVVLTHADECNLAMHQWVRMGALLAEQLEGIPHYLCTSVLECTSDWCTLEDVIGELLDDQRRLLLSSASSKVSGRTNGTKNGSNRALLETPTRRPTGEMPASASPVWTAVTEDTLATDVTSPSKSPARLP